MKYEQSMASKLAVLMIAAMAQAVLAYQITDQEVEGYWQIRSSDAKLFGVLHFHVNKNHLVAYGIRLNVVNPKQKINWTCTYGNPKLNNKAVWGGGVLLDMQRSDEDASYFYDGDLISAVGCVILHPKILFTSPSEGTMTITTSIDYLDYDKQLTNTVAYYLEKITRKKALEGCSHVITQQDKQRWGDLVHSSKARQSMLKDLGLSRKSWLRLANEYKICFDY